MGGAAFVGTLVGTPRVTGGRVELRLSGQYVSLPPVIVRSMTAFSMEMWVDTGMNSGTTLPLFVWGDALGTSTECIYVNRYTGGSVFAGWNRNGAPICTVTSSQPFDGQTNMHVVLTIAGDGFMRLYINNLMTVSSSCGNVVLPPANYFAIGNSPAAVLNVSLNEFRVWTGVLSAADVAAHFSQGPGELITK